MHFFYLVPGVSYHALLVFLFLYLVPGEPKTLLPGASRTGVPSYALSFSL